MTGMSVVIMGLLARCQEQCFAVQGRVDGIPDHKTGKELYVSPAHLTALLLVRAPSTPLPPHRAGFATWVGSLRPAWRLDRRQDQPLENERVESVEPAHRYLVHVLWRADPRLTPSFRMMPLPGF